MSPALSTTKMNLEGLIDVLGNALYSTPDVAIRELVQNAHDSCVRRRIEAPETQLEAPPEIRVSCDPAAGTVTIEDRGAGLTAREVEDYLATVGSGYTRLLRDSGGDESLIGYFGLGFLSAYVVAERVRVWTCSYQSPGVSHVFSSRSGKQYLIDEGDPRPIGTEVTLELKEAFAHLARPERLQAILERYTALLDVPLISQGAVLNSEPPPWRAPAPNPVALRRQCLAFATRFERTFEPLVARLIGQGGDGPREVEGVLWIQDGGTFATSDHRNVSLYLRGMLIGEDERDLLPAWAGFFGAVFESRTLRPTASRETLKKDDAYARARDQIKTEVIATLLEIAKTEPQAWASVRLRHNEALLAASLCEPVLFDALEGSLTVPTSEGDFTLPALVRRSKGKIHLARGESRGARELLFRALRTPIVDGSRYAVAPFCREYAHRAKAELVELGTGTGDGALFGPSGLDAPSERTLRSCFDEKSLHVVICQFQPHFLPFVVVRDEEQRLKERIEADEANRRVASATLGLARLYTASIDRAAPTKLYVNAKNRVIQRLLAGSERAQQDRGSARPADLRAERRRRGVERARGGVRSPGGGPRRLVRTE